MRNRQRQNMPIFVWPDEEERKRQEQERIQKEETPVSNSAKLETYNWMNRMNAPSAVQAPATFKDISMRDALISGRGPFANQKLRDYMLQFLPNALKTAGSMDEMTEAIHQNAFNRGTGVYADNNVRFGTAFLRPEENERDTATGSFYRDRALLQEKRIANAIDAGAIDSTTAMLSGRFDLMNPDQLSRAIAQAELGLEESRKKDAAWEEYLDTNFTEEWQRNQEQQRIRSNLAVRVGQDYAKNKGNFDQSLLQELATFAGMPISTIEERNAVNAYAHEIAKNPQAFIGGGQTLEPVDEYKSQTRYYETVLDNLNAEEQRKTSSAELRSDPEWEVRSQYVDNYNGDYSSRFTYDTSTTPMQNLFGLRYANSQEDDLYHYINNEEFQNEYEKEALSTGTTYGDNNLGYNSVFGQAGYHLLTDSEKEEFNYKWSDETAGQEEAKAYLESLKPTLLKRRADIQKAAAETFAEEAPVAAFTLSGAARLADTGLAGARLLTSAMGEDGNSIWSDLNRFSGNVDARQLEMAAEAMPWEIPFTNITAGETLLGAAQGARDNGIRYAASFFFGGSPTAASAINQLLGSTSAVNSYLAQADSDDPYGNVMKALATGAIEYVTEKIGFDALFGNRNDFIKHIKAYFAEGGEEVLSGAANTFADELYAYLTDSKSKLDTEYEQNLMRYRNEQDAARATTNDWLKGLGGDFLIGTLSSAGMVAASDVQNHAQNTQTGQRVQENDYADRLLQLAETMPEGTESRKLADKIRPKPPKAVTKAEAEQPAVVEAPAETVQNAPQEATEEQTTEKPQETAQAPKTQEKPGKKGKKLSAAKVGQLYRSLYNDLDAQGKQTVASVMESSVKERLTALGEDPASTDDVAAPLAKLLADGTLTNREKQVIARSVNAMRVYNEIRFAEDDTYSSGWVEEAGQSVTEATKGTNEARAELENMLAPKVLRPAVEAAQRTVAENGMAVANAKHGTDAKLGVQLTGEGGKTQDAEILQVTGVTKQGMQVKVKGSDGQTKTVDMADMKFANRDTATIAAYIQKAPHVFTADEASKMLQTYMGGDVQEHISGFTTLYNAGYAGRTIPPSKMTQAQLIYDLGKEDAVKDEANRLKSIGTGKRGTGKVSFAPGVEKAGLKDVQRHSEYALRVLGKAAGVDFVLYESTADAEGNYRAANGRYQNNTLYLDLNSGKNNKNDITEYAILRTAAHELTHYIEHNSAEGYTRLKDYVKNEYARKGKSWDNLVEAKLATRTMNSRLTRAGAEAEVMADAMEMMLQDSKAIERLQKRDQSLYEKIKRFIADYFRRVREAFANVGAAHDEARWLMEEGADGIMHYTEKMVQLWDEALVEAAETVQEKTETSEQMPEPVEQFALRNTVEKRKDGLVAVHNLSANKFMDTLQLGGFPMPSIAIIKAKQGHDMYGDISVVFGPESIDPQANKANRVYGNDAWTPVFPRVETEIDSDELYKAEMDIEKAANKVDAELGKKSRMFFGNFGGTDVTSKTIEDIVDSAWNNQGVLAAYLTESGKPVEVLTKEVDAERPYNPAKAQQYDMILDIIDTTDYATMPMYEFLNTYGDKLSSVSGQMARLNAYWKNDDRRAGASMARIIKEAIEYEGAGRDVSEKKTTVKDFEATRKAMEAKADKAEFDAWIAQKLSSAFGQQGIYNGKDRFTPSGNRRSFKQTHYEYNVENVVRAMLQEQESAIPAVNASGLKAAASSRYGSLDDIRSDAYRLGKVSEEQFNALMTKADNDLHDFFNAIEAWDYDVEEEAGNLLVKAAKQKLNASGIAKLFKANGFNKATVNVAKIAESVIKQVQTIPTGYFEAKPARVVSFDEVRMVVAPDTMPVKLVNMLDERGIPYTTYNGSEADRLEKLNAVEDVQFSPREINDPQLRKDASLVTDADVKAMLQMCKSNTAKNDTSIDASYIPLKKNTPEYLLKIAEAKQAPLIMQVQKARQAMAPENMKFGSSHGHAMTPDEIVQCMNLIDKPEYAAFNYLDDRAAVVIVSPIDRRAVITCFDFGENKNPTQLNGYGGGSYNVLVTMFKRNDVEEAIDYLDKGNYIEKPLDEEATATSVPLLSNREVSENSILQTAGIDNPSPEENFQESRREVTPHTLAYSYMETMQPTTSMNESERWLLGKYQRTVKELQEKQDAYNEQRNLAVNGTSAEERTKAKARANLLDKQMGHLRETLRKAERSEGFATLMNTAQKVAERFMTDENNLLAADASDRLDNELADVQAQLKAITKQLANAETGQRTAFAKGLFNAKALNEAGQTIRKAFNTRMSGKEISNRLALAYAELYAENNPERFATAMRALAQDVLESSKSRYRSPVLADLKDNIGSIGLSEAQKQELAKNGITISDFKRVVNPVVQVIDGGADLGTIVSSAEYYGTGIISQLSSADSEGDMIMTLYNTIRDERAKETEATMEGMSHEESIGYTMAEIMNTANFPLAENGANLDAVRNALIEGIEGNRAIATQVDKALATAKRASASAGNLWRKAAEINSAGKQAVEYYRAIDEQRRLLEQEELVQQLKSEAAQELKKQRQDFHDRMDRDRRVRDMNMKAAQHRKHLAAHVKKLDGLIRHETDYKHVPEELKPLVETFVGAFTEKGVGIVFNKPQADKLSRVYRKLLQTDGSMNQLGYLYDGDVMARMDELNDLLEDELAVRSGKGMTMEERAANRLATMENLAEIADSVYGMVKMANELFYGGKKAQFAAIGTEAMQAMEQRQDYRRLKGKAGENVEAADNFMRAGNMTPVYFFDRLKNKVFKTLYGDMLAAQDEYAFRVAEARRFWQETKDKYNYDSWADDTALTMTTENGKQLTLDKEDAMSVYATWKREHADELLPSYHLEEGGIVLEGNQMQDSDKKYLVAVRTTPATLSQKDMEQIYTYLAEEQRAYADAVVEYMSTTMADYGNETSMELYGIKKYKEGYYFPMKTAGDQLYQKSTAGGGQVTDDNRVKHRSFTKARVRGAATPVVIGKFSNVAAMHMEQMILYSTMTMPIESMNRVLNYKHQFEDGSKTTVRALMEQKYGPVMKRYMETFLSDMNGGIRRDSREAGLNKLVSLFKRGSVLASASVVVQQPTAIARATAMISPKHLMATTVPRKGDYDELKNHSGVAILKSMGKFDVDMGAATAEWMLDADEGSYSMWQKVRQAANIKDFETFKKRWNTIFTWAPGKADEVTWAWLWRAVKAEQAEAHPEMNTGSEAFLDVCGERFNDIVNHTQVYDSTLVRSQNMRSKSGMMQMLTSFMSEPTLTANMLYDALSNKERGKKYAVRAVTAALVSQILTSLAQALVSAGRDEDEKKTWLEKYAGKAASNLASNLNPMNMLPLLSDIQSLIDGYDVTRADMSIFVEIQKAIDKLDNENLSAYRKAEELGGSLAKLVGIPAKNIMRDARSLVTTFFGNADRPTSGYAVGEAVKGGLILGYNTKPEAYYEKAYQALAKGNQATVDTIREYMTSVGGKDDNDIDNGIRNRLKLRVDNGEMSKDEAIRWLVEHKLAKNTREAFDEVDKWTDTKAYKESVDDYSYKKYGEIEMALKKGDTKTVKTLMDEMLKYGNKEDDVISAIKTSIGNLYKNGELTKAEATKLYKHYDPKADDEDIFWLHDKWDLTKKNADVDGYNWTKTGAFLDSIPNGGKTMVSEAKKLLDNGVKKGSISSAIKNRYKDQFVELYKKGQAANLLARLLSAYEAIGYSRGAMQSKIMSWLTEDEEE